MLISEVAYFNWWLKGSLHSVGVVEVVVSDVVMSLVGTGAGRQVCSPDPERLFPMIDGDKSKITLPFL